MRSQKIPPKFAHPKLELQNTTLWDYPSQSYGNVKHGSRFYEGVTPAFVIWNVLTRFSKKGDTVCDPMCGSGTTLDVCKELGRNGKGFDLKPFREDILQADARKIPLPNESVHCVFLDPPYSTHIEYSDDPRCIGKLDAQGKEYYQAMEQVLREVARILKKGGYFALYVSDSFQKGKSFMPIGFELFQIVRKQLEAVDIIAVKRYNQKLAKAHWNKAALEGNFFFRGFNYLFLFRKGAS